MENDEWGQDRIEERLKRISQSIIEAYRAKDAEFIRRYALQAGIGADLAAAPLNKLFGRVIQVFHPDRVKAAQERVASGGAADAFLALREFRGSPRRGAARESSEAFDRERDEEEYAFGEEDFGYSEADLDDLESGGIGGESFENDEYGDSGAMDVLEAIKRAYLGNLDGYPSPLELEMLEGELDLSGMDIRDAEGAQWLKSLSSLILAGNRIDACGPIGEMHRLESLDLSDNALEDADPLAELEFLSELDLSGNDIEDFAFLARLPSLRYVNLTGNPPIRPALKKNLEAKGVIVIQ